jgi:hypothetical protein
MSTIFLGGAAVAHPIGAKIDYGFDLTTEIARIEAGDTIASVAWTVPPALTKTALTPEIDGLTVRTRLTGGTVGGVYTVKALVVLTGGEEIPVSGTLTVVPS